MNYLGGRVYAATESTGGSGSWLRIGDRLISYNFTKIPFKALTGKYISTIAYMCIPSDTFQIKNLAYVLSTK